MDRKETILIIPAYNPTEAVLEVVDDLTSKGYQIVVVNDDSDV